MVAWLSCFAKIFCASYKNVSSVFRLADCTLEKQLSEIGSRSSLMTLNQKAGFCRYELKVIICGVCFIQFVVYSMQNVVLYRTAKKVVFR